MTNPVSTCWLKSCWKSLTTLYISLLRNEEISFSLLAKLRTVCAVSIKPISKKTLLGSILVEKASHQGKSKVERNDGCKTALRSGYTKSTN